MTVSRGGAASSIVDGRWWITGGARAAHDTTEYFNEGTSTFVSAWNLAQGFAIHCQLTIDSTRIFLGTGDERNILFDVTTGNFVELPPPKMAREYAACGIVRRADGDEIHIVSDESSR